MNNQIRILHIVSSLSTGNGMMNMLMNYYRNLDHDKIQFDFMYFIQMPSTFDAEIKNLGGSIYQMPKPSLRTSKSYNDFFERHRGIYKAVHLHLVSLNSILLPMAKRYGIKHLIVHSHNTKYSDKKLSAIRNRILCLPIKRQANIYLACSKDAGIALYGRKYVESGKVRIVKNAIDISRFIYNPNTREKIRNELSLNNKLVIGHVGRFAEQKNHTFLLKVFAEILKDRPDSILMLIGDGPLFQEIQNKAKAIDIADSVLFIGTKKNVEDYLQAMDVFVLPSIFEGLGIVAIEAQASGLPCVVSDTVPEEAFITQHITSISLKTVVSVWSKKIMELFNEYRNKDRNNGIIDYDINKEVNELSKIYLSLD